MEGLTFWITHVVVLMFSSSWVVGLRSQFFMSYFLEASLHSLSPGLLCRSSHIMATSLERKWGQGKWDCLWVGASLAEHTVLYLIVEVTYDHFSCSIHENEVIRLTPHSGVWGCIRGANTRELGSLGALSEPVYLVGSANITCPFTTAYLNMCSPHADLSCLLTELFHVLLIQFQMAFP